MALSLKSRLQEMNSRRPRLTLLGRSLLLLSTELAVNAVCWIVTGILFGRKRSTQPILSLALLAWTIGLRHALDADHISAIDNATRSLIGMGQLPVTCGLFFSLGHSTIVIVVNVAIAISTDVYNHIGGVGEVGGIIGAAVSGSFLFIVGLANSILLWRVLVKRRKWKLERTERIAGGESEQAVDDDIAARAEKSHGNTLMMKIIGPIVTFVDRPWKMYPVGVLFGFGFDTASSIALLAVSAIAKKDSDGNQIAPADIVILPLLFTAGMTLVDSLDSILMLYSYAGFPERGFALFERPTRVPVETTQGSVLSVEALPPSPRKTPSPTGDIEETVPQLSTTSLHRIASSSKASTADDDDEEPTLTKEDLVRQRQVRMRHNAMSGLSIMLTLMSIFVAFAISLITIMGLIGDNCTACQDAANDPDGGGLAGRWWRGWANANDQSGYIGAAIVGSFVTVVGIWYGGRYAWRRYRQGRAM